MFFLPSVHRHPQFRAGIRSSSSVAPGIAAWGLMTGVAMIKSGMSLTEAVAMTLWVYAGSSQLAAIPLLAAGAPAWVVWATALCVNLRFVVFSLHLRDYLMHMPRWRRLVNGFLTADMSYALFTQRYPQPSADPAGRAAQEAFLAGNYFLLCLVGIVCSLANTRLRLVAALVAGAAAVATYALPLKLNVVVAIVVAVLACLWLEGRMPAAARERAA
jgi:predicted branched-subunit amino acid permease